MLYRKPAEKLTRIMQDYAKIGSSAAADEVVEAFRIAYPEIFNLAQTEFRTIAVSHDEGERRRARLVEELAQAHVDAGNYGIDPKDVIITLEDPE